MSTPQLEDFQIGWICALPIEAAAAKEMLDENFGLLGMQDPSDPNIYTLGRIGQHNVVIACLPAGQYGNISAVTVANNMTRTFSKSLRIGLMVGVGGGIPSAAHDIRLGDVVISCPQGTSGGVLQYDIGKIRAGGEFRRSGSLNSPPRSLLMAVNAMKAAELTDDPCFPEYIHSATGRTARTRQSFGRPSTQQDRLFQLEYEHPVTEDTCDRCPVEWEETRTERKSNNPQLHYGIIASGNVVMEHGWTREKLRLETDALCFEMEAAGLMMDFPCLVIRGICDYADSHKNKQWQGYAALAAASYTKELLGYIPVGNVSRESLVVDVCSGLREELKCTNQHLEKLYNQQEIQNQEQKASFLTEQQRQCHQVFKISNYEEQKNINPHRVPGTCQWVTQNTQYLHWWDNCTHDLLWISADPGCGKSVLARSLIDIEFKASSSNVSICYFFFKDNQEQNSLATALCAVLHQLFSQQPQLIRHAVPSWERNGDKLQHEVDELWRVLVSAASDAAFQNLICVFDALDECCTSHRERLIAKLEDLRRSTIADPKAWIKFLVTSRPYDDIQTSFRGITNVTPHIRLRGEDENLKIRGEIDHVVKLKVQELAESLALSPNLQQKLEQQLFRMEHRTYLWLHLAINDVHDTFRDSLRPDEETIRMLPPSVTAAYQKILDRVPPGQTATVKKILMIIAGACRPLSIDEMAMALGVAVSPKHGLAKDAGLDPMGLGQKIRRLCGLFVFVQSSRIYLIHQTAKEFLVERDTAGDIGSPYSFCLSDAHHQISEICVRYLLSGDLQDSGFDHRVNVQSLLAYAAEYWAYHVRNAPPAFHIEAESVLDQIYDTSTTNFAIWFPIFWKSAMRNHEQPALDAVHLAALNGHGQIARKLITSNQNALEGIDSTGSNGLIWASRNGHIDVVNTFLQAGSNVNAQGGRLGNALYAASSKGHENIVHMLLDWGADVNAKCRGYNNVKRTASGKSHEEILQIIKNCQVYEGRLHLSSTPQRHDILQFVIRGREFSHFSSTPQLHDIVQVEIPGREFSHSLYAASSKGHKTIVKMLLEHGADVNAEGGLCGNSLQAACAEGHKEIVSVLLQWGANINSQGLFDSPLYVAAAKGYVDIVLQLLEYGANVNSTGEQYVNALLAAAAEGHAEIMQMLLGHDASISHHKSPALNLGVYGTAVVAASARGAANSLSRLLALKATIDVATESAKAWSPYEDESLHETTDSGTILDIALIAASLQGNCNITVMLLQGGADVNAEGGRYGNALQAACSEGHEKIIQLLLDHGANINSQGGWYGNALHAACFSGYKKIVQLLLNRGADINIQGDKYGNALQAACSTGHEKIIQLLLNRGANINAQGGLYGNALHAACSSGYKKIVQLLLDRGADINIQGDKYGNALQAACSTGHEKIVQLLLDRGADINAQGGWYRNALRAACSTGHEKIVQLLLDRGADINAQGGWYGNALRAACSEGHEKIVQLLLDRGADINSQGDEYGNALQDACSEGHEKIVQLLLNHGADINIQGDKYGNALQAACSNGYKKIVQLLLDRGADINAQGGHSGNALQAACSMGDEKIVQLLLDRGADVKAQGGHSGNALQAASSKGYEHIVQLLLDRGADVNAQGGHSGNALQAASSKGHENIVQLLLDRGAELPRHSSIDPTPSYLRRSKRRKLLRSSR